MNELEYYVAVWGVPEAVKIKKEMYFRIKEEVKNSTNDNRFIGIEHINEDSTKETFDVPIRSIQHLYTFKDNEE